MSDAPDNSRRLVYPLLIVIAAGAMAGRILNAELLYEPSLHRNEQDPSWSGRLWPKTKPQPMPTFSSNDRSRWATVRALVDEGTFVVGRRDYMTTLSTVAGATAGGAHLLDKVGLLQAGFVLRTKSDTGIIFEDGWGSVDKVLHPSKLEFYSSKPPLLSTLVAGLYWLLKTLFGWTFATHPFAIVRTILILVNLLPFIIYLVLLARIVDFYGQSDWGRFFVFAAGCFATLVTPFANTLNNHTIATYSVMFALYSALYVREAHAALAGGWRLNGHLASAGFFAAFAVCNELPALAFAGLLFLALLYLSPGRTLFFFLPAALIPVAAFLITNYLAVGQLRPAYSEFGGPWYQYEGSHWRPPNPGEVKRGIDWAKHQESRMNYALHVLVGHHGWFSLTPIWLLGLWGMGRGLFGRSPPEAPLPRLLFAGTLLVSIVVVGFYIQHESANYGGWTAGLRWLMWLTPLWLLCLIPAADQLGECRTGRTSGYLLLGFSVLAVSYPAWNPWRHPWIYAFMQSLGWPGY